MVSTSFRSDVTYDRVEFIGILALRVLEFDDFDDTNPSPNVDIIPRAFREPAAIAFQDLG